METYKELQLNQIKFSPSNPRKHFDPEKMKELSQSIREKGILQPILVRPIGKTTQRGPAVQDVYELVCGDRRLKAAEMISLDKVPAVIRELDDNQVLEIQITENLQRADIHPMEEAEGYFILSHNPGYDAARISEKIGRSVKYVYDRMKLLSLTKEGRDLFLANKFTAGHAILLARLSPSQQKEALDPASQAVFTHEAVTADLYMTAEEREDDEAIKPRSVRELQIWIDDHVRFDRTKVDPMLFPDTDLALKSAKEEEEKIVPITEKHYVQTSARATERTVGPRSWMRADGKEGSKTCEHSVTGVFVVGPGRGEALKVCLAKETCKIHWGDWQKEREDRQKAPAVNEKEKAREEVSEKQRQEAERKRQEWENRYKKAIPAILKTISHAILKVNAGASGPLASIIFENGNYDPGSATVLPKGKTAEDLVRHLANADLAILALNSWHRETLLGLCKKHLKLDINKIVNEAVPEEKKAAEPNPQKMTMNERVAKRATEINRERAAAKKKKG